MPIKKIKNTTNGQRTMTVLTYEEITTNKPHKALLMSRKERAGRNSHGIITVRHRGAGNKIQIRVVDFKQNDKLNIEATVKTVEYDPNRSAFIMLVLYKDGEYRYHLAPDGIKVGDRIMTAKKTKARVGNRMMLENIPVGFDIHNVQIDLSGKGQLVKTAGSAAKLVSLDGEYAQVQLPSGEVRFVHKECFATVGRVSNIDHANVTIGKAGRNRHKGQRPEVRGKAMNPNDHPHGGGEGNCPIGLKYPKTPWGLHALGVKTRRRKDTNRWIVKTRKGKMVAELTEK
jgi:large subunit ribosomal protein L2